MIYLIILAIFLVPMVSVVTIPGTIIWFPQLLALQLMGGFCFGSMFWKLNKFIAIFLGYLCFSYVYVTSANPRTLMCLMIGYGAMAICLVASKIKNTKPVYIALVVMALLSISYSIFQKLGIDPIFVPNDHNMRADTVSFMGSYNQLGDYSCANAFWFPWLMPLSIIPIFFTKCNSALIGVIGGGMVCSYFQFGRKFTLIFGALLLALLIPWWHFCHKSDTELGERLNLWKLTADQIVTGRIDESDLQGHKYTIKDNPILGFGLGNFFTYSPFSQYKIWGLKETHVKSDVANYEQHFYEHAHNDFLEAIYELGYLGAIFILLIVSSVVSVFVSSIKTTGVVSTFSSLVAQCLASCSIYIMHAPVSLFIFCLTLGLFYAEVQNAKPSQISQNT